jgi:hypothetical protein
VTARRVLALALLAAPAGAEPRVVLLVDTSASMLWSSCGAVEIVEGTAECPGADVACETCEAAGCGDGQDNDSRLDAMRAAIGGFVAACEGTRFGLARFHQEPVAFECPFGGWRGTSVACRDVGFDSEPGEGYNRADVLVDVRRGDVDELDAWIDGEGDATSTECDLCADCGGGCDRELRASGGTPVAGSLRTVRRHLLDEVMPDDPGGGPYLVFLFSDGLGNCPGDPIAEAEATCEAGIGVQAVGFSGTCPMGCEDPCFFDCEGGTCPSTCADAEGQAAEECARDCDPSCLAACQIEAIARAGCGPSCAASGCSDRPLRVEDGAALAATLARQCPSDRRSADGCGCTVGAPAAAPPGWTWGFATAAIGCRLARRRRTSRAG